MVVALFKSTSSTKIHSHKCMSSTCIPIQKNTGICIHKQLVRIIFIQNLIHMQHARICIYIYIIYVYTKCLSNIPISTASWSSMSTLPKNMCKNRQKQLLQVVLYRQVRFHNGRNTILVQWSQRRNTCRIFGMKPDKGGQSVAIYIYIYKKNIYIRT